MKLINIALIFIIITVSFIYTTDINTSELVAISNFINFYDRAIESAVDDGVNKLVEVDANKNLILYKEESIEQFFTSLYSNLGIIGEKLKEESIKRYIPVILITDNDGFFIYYADTHTVNNEKLLLNKFSEKYYFDYEEGTYIYSFTVDEKLKVFHKPSKTIYTGLYEDIQDSLVVDGLAPIKEKKELEDIKRNTIIGNIQSKMEMYINEYNTKATDFGIQYNFWLPAVDEGDFYRTIQNRGMMVIMQGYPLGIRNKTYNHYDLSGARVKKSIPYYINTIDSIKYYHREECTLLKTIDKNVPFYSKEEAALQGAFPCLQCRP